MSPRNQDPRRVLRRLGGHGRSIPSDLRGAALFEAVESLDSACRGQRAREVTFAVACAVRDGDASALPALSDALRRLDVATSDEAALVNLLSAVQFAAMSLGVPLRTWAPPTGTVARMVQLSLDSGAALYDQACGLLWTLSDRGIAVDWIGQSATRNLVSLVHSSQLVEALLRDVQTHEHVIQLVPDGDIFPCVAA